MTAKTMTRRSIHVPAFQAATIPSGIATTTETISVETVSAMVGSTRCPISFITGRLVKIEMPRSPCNSPQAQVTNWI